MLIRNIKEAEAALLPYVPLVAQLTVKDTTLDRMVPLTKLLNNPEDRLKVVHIAGTSGKTSTAYYTAALLKESGKKVGLTVSPHIDSITERVQINGSPIAEAVFCNSLGLFLEIVQKSEQPPSYFELLYAFALWMFNQQGVDYAVVETGMGGLHDATNVVTRPDKVCIITDIGLDHTHILGKTLPAITRQKIGIVHTQNNVFMYQQSNLIMDEVEKWTQKKSAPLHIVDENKVQAASLDYLITMPDYQRRNWLLAYHVYLYLRARDKLPDLSLQILQTTQSLQIPARMDIRQIGNKTIVMDGAHNLQKMKAFVNSFRQLYPDVQPAILLSLKRGKEYQDLVPLLTSFAGRIITTNFNTSQDLPVRSMDPEILAKAFETHGASDVICLPDQHVAYKSLLAAPERICIITGSFYLLSQIRNNEQLV